MNLCVICLRTDKILKLSSNVLQDFYEDLCDFTVVSLISSSYYYCSECECILMTFYKFKEKCAMALKIYQRWLAIKGTNKDPINLLYTKLPSFGVSASDPDNISIFTDLSSDSQTGFNVEDKSTKDTSTREIKLEHDQSCNSENNNLTNTFKIENAEDISKQVQDEFQIACNNNVEHVIQNQSNNDVEGNTNLECSNKYSNIAISSENVSNNDLEEDTHLKRRKRYRNETISLKDVLNDDVDDDANFEDSKKYSNIAVGSDNELNDELEDDLNFEDSINYSNIANSSENELSDDLEENTNLKHSKKYKYKSGSKYSKKKINTKTLLKKVTKTKAKDEKGTSKNRKQNEESKLKPNVRRKKNETELKPKVRQKKNEEVKPKATQKKNETEVKPKVRRKINKPDKVTNEMTKKQKTYFDKAKETDKKYESVFDIEYLTTQEMKLEEFEKRKTYECYVSAEHKCEVCYQVFKSAKFLEYHTNKWHNESGGTMYCSLCKIWSSKTSSHRLTHTMVFKCKLCPLVTYHRESMHNHFEQHKGKQYRCEECKITYKSKSSYRSHMGKVHRRGCNICLVCGRGFRSPVGLAIHKGNSIRCTGGRGAGGSPAAETGVKCDQCDVTFASQEVFEAHMSDVHEPSGHPYVINSAGFPEPRIYVKKTRKAKSVRRKHVKHTCRVCNRAGVSFYWLRLHVKREHPNEDIEVLYADKKTHLCDICGAGFSTVYALRDHMNRHTGARPHACDLCPKSFHSSYLMRAHRVRHFPSAISCTLCGKQFKTPGNLCWHMKVHSGEKNHKCEICGKAFLHSANLAEHIQGVHYNIRRAKKRKAGADGKLIKKCNIINVDTVTQSNSFDPEINNDLDDKIK